MASTYISGLSSGLDWTSMISELVAVEQKPITALQDSKTALGTKKTAWSDLNSLMQSLQTSVQNLSLLDDFDVFSPTTSVTGTSNSESAKDLISVSAGTNASEGSYNITIKKLATAEKITNDVNVKTFTSASNALGISGDATINGRTLSISATDNLQDIANKINALNTGSNPANVTASLITVSSSNIRLTLTSKTTGADQIVLGDSSGVLASQLGLTQITNGQNAEISVDGNDITSTKNQITDVIKGVTLNLVGADENATITLKVNRDTDAIKTKIKDFVDNYNKVMSAIATQNTASSDGKTTGTLFGDSTLQGMKFSLRKTLLSQVSGLDPTLSSLGQIGVSIDQKGTLSINEKTLDGYLQTNFDDVRNLFTAHGTSSNSDLTFSYAAAGASADEGDYEVEVDQAATQAGVTGSGFSGTLGNATTLSITNAGGTVQTISLSAGSDMDAIVEAINDGNTFGITAENVGGQLKLTSKYYGTNGNFTVSNGTELGVDGTYTGVDVVGSIRKQGDTDWISMTGQGQFLIGKEGTDVAGFSLSYTGTGTGTFDFNYSKGVGQKFSEALYSITNITGGYIAGVEKSLQSRMDNIDKKIADKEAKLSAYQDSLIARFSQMESLLSSLKSQQSWLTQQIDSMNSSSS